MKFYRDQSQKTHYNKIIHHPSTAHSNSIWLAKTKNTRIEISFHQGQKILIVSNNLKLMRKEQPKESDSKQHDQRNFYCKSMICLRFQNGQIFQVNLAFNIRKVAFLSPSRFPIAIYRRVRRFANMSRGKIFSHQRQYYTTNYTCRESETCSCRWVAPVDENLIVSTNLIYWKN